MINQTAQPPAWLKVLYFVQILYPAIYGIPKFIAIIRQLRARIPQTAIGGKPQRSRNRQINASPSDFALFGAFGFRVGLYVPGAFAANTRIPAQAAGIEYTGQWLTSCAAAMPCISAGRGEQRRQGIERTPRQPLRIARIRGFGSQGYSYTPGRVPPVCARL